MTKPGGLEDLAELTEEDIQQARRIAKKLGNTLTSERFFKGLKAQAEAEAPSRKAEITEEDWEAVRRDLRQVQQDIEEIKWRIQND